MFNDVIQPRAYEMTLDGHVCVCVCVCVWGGGGGVEGAMRIITVRLCGRLPTWPENIP